jgi:hypothetical protein
VSHSSLFFSLSFVGISEFRELLGLMMDKTIQQLQQQHDGATSITFNSVPRPSKVELHLVELIVKESNAKPILSTEEASETIVQLIEASQEIEAVPNLCPHQMPLFQLVGNSPVGVVERSM